MTDHELKQHVLNAMDWEPGLNANDVGIAVDDGVVTLRGVREKIEAALKRSAEVDARRINVTAEDGKVILRGNVHSWTERQAAARAAWAAPGVTHVEDDLAIAP